MEILKESRLGGSNPKRWQGHHTDLLFRSSDITQDSERLRVKCKGTSTFTSSKTESDTKSVTEGLDDKMKDTLELKEYLKDFIERAMAELGVLESINRKLQRVLFALELPRDANIECENIRKFRLGIDQTLDDVSYNLNKESKIINTGINLMRKSKEEILEAKRRLSNIKRLLEKDWSNKQETLQIDHYCAKLQFKIASAQFKAVSAAMNEGTSTPRTWSDLTEMHKRICDKEMKNDKQLRESIEQAIYEVCQDIVIIGETVDTTLIKSIEKLEEADRNLQAEDFRVKQEIQQQELNIALLRQELQNKESPLQISESRSWERSFRPGKDKCLDTPHHRLQEEMRDLPRAIDNLRILLGTSEEMLESLQRNHEELIKNILARQHTLNLEKRCVIVRKGTIIPAKLKGY